MVTWGEELSLSDDYAKSIVTVQEHSIFAHFGLLE